MRSGSKFHRTVEGGEDEGEGGWMASYSDLMTDLLAIFVVLFSFAMINQSIVKSMATAEQNISPAFESLSTQDALSSQESLLTSQDGILSGQDDTSSDQSNLNELIESINSYITEAELSELLSVTKQGDHQIMLRVAGSVLFDSGRADINTNADQLLERLSNILTGYADSIEMIRIEGHTDNRPTNPNLFDSNWELSTSRAVNVLRRLLDISSLGPEKFSAVGYGEHHPVADNDTTSGRAKNRRVDFIIETVNN
jgi:chemotaxis protein MotB